MRLPKFRAWDKETKKMYEVTCIDFIKKMVCTLEKDPDKICRWIPFKKAVLMQSTGLKDKNGVEIFEGDVIGSQNKNRKNWYISHHEVVWHEAGFMGKQICSISFIGLEYWTKGENGYVVIGNIYENPKLLKEV